MKSIYIVTFTFQCLTGCKKNNSYDFCNTYVGDMTVMKNVNLPDSNFYSLDTFYNHQLNLDIQNDLLHFEMEKYNFNIPINQENINGNIFIDSTSNGGYFLLKVRVINYDTFDFHMIDFRHPNNSSSSEWYDRNEVKYLSYSN